MPLFSTNYRNHFIKKMLSYVAEDLPGFFF